jgi:hypothetical protein
LSNAPKKKSDEHLHPLKLLTIGLLELRQFFGCLIAGGRNFPDTVLMAVMQNNLPRPIPPISTATATMTFLVLDQFAKRVRRVEVY